MKLRGLILSLAIVGCTSAALPVAVPPAPAGSLLYVCNQNDATVSVVQVTTMTVQRTVDLKALGFSANAKPHHVVVEPDGSFWYVTLIGDNRIVKLDRNDRVVAQAQFETPGMLALHPTANLLFVGRSMTAVNPPTRIGVLRRSDLEIDEVNVVFPRPHALAIHPNGSIVYTASLAVNQLAALDVRTERVELTQVAGPQHALMQFAVSPDGRTLAVSAELSARVLLFDLTDPMKPALTAEIAVEAQPFDPAFSPDGRYLVLGNKGTSAVTIIDAAARTIAGVVRGAGLAQPHGTVISADSRYAYVSNNNLKGTGEHAMHALVGGSQSTPAQPAGPGTIVVVDLNARRIAKVLEVGHNATGLALSKPPPPPPPPPPPVLQFVRSIAPFPVLDPDGTPYAHPFLGGLDVPRPHFIDIDGDGDFDLFVQERSNELMFFENTGSARAPSYVWRADKYQNLDVGEWTRFVDYDADGDIDLFGETPFSYMRVFRNDGGKQQARFTLATDSLRDVTGKPIFADRQNIPQIVDIDCDKRLDLFIGRVEGTITHYEEAPGRQAGEAPRFEFQEDRWENIEIVAQMRPSLLHGANTMFFADHDSDGDLDLFWGDFFEDGVLLIPNHGACATPNLQGERSAIMTAGAKLSTSGYNVPVLVDLDGDRDLDLFVGVLGGAFNPNTTASDNFYFLERLASGGLELRTRRFLSTIDVGNESAPALGDIDGDGDLDLLVGNKLDAANQESARLYLFRNTGSTKQPTFALRDTISLASSFHYAPALADLDADGDLDLVLGTWNQGVQIYRNEGTRQQPRWVQDTAAAVQLTRGSNSAPALGDLDGDGDLDLMVGEASGQLNYFRNVGTAKAPRFELVSDEYEGFDVGRRSQPALVDLDGDGDLDLVCGSEDRGVTYFHNDGTRQAPKFIADKSLAIALPSFGAPAFGDLDGDGDLDVVSGASAGGLHYFERRN